VQPSDKSQPPTWREVSAGNGMTGQSMPWTSFGFGAYAGKLDVEVRFTDGTIETLPGIEGDRYVSVVYGTKTAMNEVRR
jgi:hypothetical protein